MKYVLKADEMKRCDQNTIKGIGIPSMVLMERAALAVCEEITATRKKINKALIVAGMGNNGGDGLAVGRLLALQGAQVTFYMAGSHEKMSEETKKQALILKNLGISIQSKLEDMEYDMVVDALFGVGLSREIQGDFAEIVLKINRYRQQGAFICSVDIPSGICADTGKILGCGVRADLTVTFGFVKRGHLLYPGKSYAGMLKVKDIGILKESFFGEKPQAFCYEAADIPKLLPVRAEDGNKGTFGKALLIAGSYDMSGACILCAKAVLRAGAGMVKIITPACNRQIIQIALPEAMLYTFGEMPCREKVEEAFDWADVAVAGPGMGTDESARMLMEYVLEQKKIPVVIDADGLNLLAAHKELEILAADGAGEKLILTPHPGELGRLLKTGKEEYLRQREQLVVKLAEKFGCTVAAKDAVTLVVQAGRREIYINTSGNDGMAAAGSGDVLAGIIGGLLAQRMEVFKAVCAGSYLHGVAGDKAAVWMGHYGMTATDIINAFTNITNIAVRRGPVGNKNENREQDTGEFES